MRSRSCIMKFISTRSNIKLSFEEALFCCYTKDGGLLMPEVVPKIQIDELKKWKELSYIDIVKRLVSLYVSAEEVPEEDQHVVLDEAFKHFDTKNVVEVARLKGGLTILELWHGDTLAFKDLAMTCTIQFMNYFMKKRRKHFTSIVVTSGDTGSSAMYAAQNASSIDVLVLYPHNRISTFQELMMTTLDADNLHVYAVDGSSDEIDAASTKVLTDSDFVGKYNVGTMNSMNWCRIMVQIAHHIYGYLQAATDVGDPVNIIVPCGGCGNITALMIARDMGVPIRPIAVCNKNDTFHQMIATNKLLLTEVEVSRAPAMDISYALNIERIVWLLSGQDTSLVRAWVKDFIETRETRLPRETFEKLNSEIRSAVASDDVIVSAIKRCWEENEYHICPHTATAVAHFYGLTSPGASEDHVTSPTLCIATASAAKFAEVLEDAGLPPCKSDKIEVLRDLKKRAQYVSRDEDWEKLIRGKVIKVSS